MKLLLLFIYALHTSSSLKRAGEREEKIEREKWLNVLFFIFLFARSSLLCQLLFLRKRRVIFFFCFNFQNVTLLPLFDAFAIFYVKYSSTKSAEKKKSFWAKKKIHLFLAALCTQMYMFRLQWGAPSFVLCVLVCLCTLRKTCFRRRSALQMLSADANLSLLRKCPAQPKRNKTLDRTHNRSPFKIKCGRVCMWKGIEIINCI